MIDEKTNVILALLFARLDRCKTGAEVRAAIFAASDVLKQELKRVEILE